MNYDLRIFAAWAQLYPARCAREKLRILTEHKTITIYELRFTNYELRLAVFEQQVPAVGVFRSAELYVLQGVVELATYGTGCDTEVVHLAHVGVDDT